MANQKRRQKKNNKMSVVFLALIVVVASTVWLTMALLTARSDDTRNTFTLGNNVKIQLDEPKYCENETDITNIKKNFMPGDTIDKDPTIKIEGGLDIEYIAAKVFYYIDKNGDGVFSDSADAGEKVTYTEFKTYASIGTQTDEDDKTTYSNNVLGDNWFTIDDYETFFYGAGTGKSSGIEGAITKLTPFEKEMNGTIQKTVLFNKVKVNADIPLYDADTHKEDGITILYRKGQPVSFQIQVKAYAVQAGDGITWQQAASDFKNVFGLNIGTTSLTP